MPFFYFMHTDSLTNVLAGLGSEKAKATHSRYTAKILDNKELLDAYRFAWLPANVVDMPADAATRAWRKWNAEPEAVFKIEEAEERLGLQAIVNEALKEARLFGTSAIFIDTGSKTPHIQLNTAETIKNLELVELEGGSNFLQSSKPAALKANGREIHPSRLCIFRGKKIPRQFWGDSVLNAVYTALINADSTSANIAELVFEAKIDVFKIPDLMQNLADPSYQNRLMDRLRLAQAGKSTVNGLVTDALEEYEQKQISFGGLNEVLQTALQIAAGASQIPASVLLGKPIGGLNSTGDNEIRDFYDNASSLQNNIIKPTIHPIDDLILAELGLSNVDYEWVSLWQETNAEKAENISKIASGISALANTMLFDDETLRKATAQALGDYMPAIEVTE